MLSDNYCPLIYQGLYVEKTNTTQAKVGACCINQTKVYNFIDFKNNNHLKHQRELNFTGAKNIECNECWRKESTSGFSIRSNMVQWFANNNLLDKPHDIKLVSLDYNTDPICNAQCIMCGPNYSSAWAAELGATRLVSQTKKNTFLENVDLSHLRRIYFNGGEPLLTQDHINILKKIPDLSQCEISYNTNGSHWPSQEVLDLWASVKQVTVHFSIDGVGDVFEYIRYPLKWGVVSNNFKKMLLLGNNIRVGVSYVVGLHNLLDLDQTYQWWKNVVKQSSQADGFHVQPINGNLGVQHAAPKLKSIFRDLLQNRTDEWAKNLLILLETETFSSQWEESLRIIDNRRNLKWQTSLKNLASVCKNH